MMDFSAPFRWLGDKTGRSEKAEYRRVPKKEGLQLNPGDLLTLGVDDTRGNIARLGLIGMDAHGKVQVHPPRRDTVIYRAIRNEEVKLLTIPPDVTYFFGRHDGRRRQSDSRHFAVCSSLPVAKIQFTLNGTGALHSRGLHDTLYSFGVDQDTWSKEAVLESGDEECARHIVASKKALVQVHKGAVNLCWYPDLAPTVPRRNVRSLQQAYLQEPRGAHPPRLF